MHTIDSPRVLSQAIQKYLGAAGPKSQQSRLNALHTMSGYAHHGTYIMVSCDITGQAGRHENAPGLAAVVYGGHVAHPTPTLAYLPTGHCTPRHANKGYG